MNNKNIKKNQENCDKNKDDPTGGLVAGIASRITWKEGMNLVTEYLANVWIVFATALGLSFICMKMPSSLQEIISSETGIRCIILFCLFAVSSLEKIAYRVANKQEWYNPVLFAGSLFAVVVTVVFYFFTIIFG